MRKKSNKEIKNKKRKNDDDDNDREEHEDFPSNEHFFVEEILAHKSINQLNLEHMDIYDENSIAFKVKWIGYGPEYDSWEPMINLAHIRALWKYFKKYLIPTIGQCIGLDENQKEIISFEFIEPDDTCVPGYYLKPYFDEVMEFENLNAYGSQNPQPVKSFISEQAPKKKRRYNGRNRRKFDPKLDGLECFEEVERSDDDALYADEESMIEMQEELLASSEGLLAPSEELLTPSEEFLVSSEELLSSEEVLPISKELLSFPVDLSSDLKDVDFNISSESNHFSSVGSGYYDNITNNEDCETINDMDEEPFDASLCPDNMFW